MKLIPWLKNILSAFVIMAGGLVLFTLAFLMTAFVTNAFIGVFGMERVGNPYGTGRWLTLLVILLLSWLVFRSKMNDTVKATFLTMPLMVVLVLTGIRFYQQPAWIMVGMEPWWSVRSCFIFTGKGFPGSIILRPSMWPHWLFMF